MISRLLCFVLKMATLRMAEGVLLLVQCHAHMKAPKQAFPAKIEVTSQDTFV